MQELYKNNTIEQNDRVLQPEVTVVMVTYNQENYVRRAIESVLCQKTNLSYELVIGEDCSTDKTRDICVDYSLKHPDKIRLLLNQKNLGMRQNTIQTLRSATGKYIAFCDGDDYWIDPEKLQTQCDFLEHHPNVYGVHSKVSYVDVDDNCIGESDLMPLDSDFVSFDYLVQKNAIHTCSFMFRRSVLNKSLYSILRFAPVSDYPLFLSVALKSDIFYIDKTLAAYRKNFGVTCSWKHENYIKCRLASYRLLKKYLNVKGHRSAIIASKQFQYLHLFSATRKGWRNILKGWYLMPLIWYTVLICFFKPPVNVHKISVMDVVKVICRSRFRLKNWRNYLTLDERTDGR